MTIAITSAAVSAIASATTASTATSKLVELASGEYTAASVTADPTDATKLGLQKEKDGNYGTKNPTDPTKTSSVATNGSVAATTSSSVQSALTSLTIGGP